MAMSSHPVSTLTKTLLVLVTEIDRDLPITVALVFAQVAEAGEDGIDQGTLMKQLSITSSSMSRTVQTLGDVHYGKEKSGLGLVIRAFDYKDNRLRLLKLTPRGKALWARLQAAVAKRS